MRDLAEFKIICHRITTTINNDLPTPLPPPQSRDDERNRTTSPHRHSLPPQPTAVERQAKERDERQRIRDTGPKRHARRVFWALGVFFIFIYIC